MTHDQRRWDSFLERAGKLVDWLAEFAWGIDSGSAENPAMDLLLLPFRFVVALVFLVYAYAVWGLMAFADLLLWIGHGIWVALRAVFSRRSGRDT